MPEIR
jgi:N-acetylmuramoyl-L-alanine amidase